MMATDKRKRKEEMQIGGQAGEIENNKIIY